MSLDWNVGNVKDWKRLCWRDVLDENGDVVRDDDGDTLQEINPVTNALVWMCMSIDLNGITAKNAREFYWRMKWLELTRRTFWLAKWDLETDKKIQYNPSWDDVLSHVGLSTNVASVVARRTWLKKQREILEKEVDYAVRTDLLASRKGNESPFSP